MEKYSTARPNTESPALLTVEEARVRLRLSRFLMYSALERGEIKHVRIGRKILVPRIVVEGIERGEVQPATSA